MKLNTWLEINTPHDYRPDGDSGTWTFLAYQTHEKYEKLYIESDTWGTKYYSFTSQNFYIDSWRDKQ